jgi:hypothetical protein
MNPPRFSNIFLGNILSIHIGTICFIILYDELQKEMGENLEKEDGLTSFEIRVRN